MCVNILLYPILSTELLEVEIHLSAILTFIG